MQTTFNYKDALLCTFNAQSNLHVYAKHKKAKLNKISYVPAFDDTFVY